MRFVGPHTGGVQHLVIGRQCSSNLLRIRTRAFFNLRGFRLATKLMGILSSLSSVYATFQPDQELRTLILTDADTGKKWRHIAAKAGVAHSFDFEGETTA